RGLSLERRLKAVYWWCYEHSPRPLPVAEILKCMSTDKTIAATYRRIMRNNRVDNILPQWGDAIIWNEFHMSTEFPIYWD
ncbi:MAG: IS256 family transposase, partial [Bacteroides sp.]|nr:IS256 family transposase [Faecalibacterium prausnitzii]MBS5552936.1 IS256 family transposase [Bacteroides sp.]